MVLNQRILPRFVSGYIVLFIFIYQKIEAFKIQREIRNSVSPFFMMLKRSSKSLLIKRQLQGDSNTDNLLESPKQKKIVDRIQFDASISLIKRKERLEINSLSPINTLIPGEQIPISWYEQDNVLDLSKRLLGCKLITCRDGVTTAGIITETEAYDGIHDAACHAHLGRRTNRTEVMFQNGGKAYVYLCYGIHSLFNIITGPEGDPCAILIRALEPIDGIDEMKKRRLPIDKLNTLCKGPGALTKALQINQTHYGITLDSPEFFLEAGLAVVDTNIASGIRIGIGEDKGESLPYRYWIRDSKFISSHRKESS